MSKKGFQLSKNLYEIVFYKPQISNTVANRSSVNSEMAWKITSPTPPNLPPPLLDIFSAFFGMAWLFWWGGRKDKLGCLINHQIFHIGKQLDLM